jgi:hypothetical protein
VVLNDWTVIVKRRIPFNRNSVGFRVHASDVLYLLRPIFERLKCSLLEFLIILFSLQELVLLEFLNPLLFLLVGFLLFLVHQVVIIIMLFIVIKILIIFTIVFCLLLLLLFLNLLLSSTLVVVDLRFLDV